MSTFRDYRVDLDAVKRKESIREFRNFCRLQRRRVSLEMERRVERIAVARKPTELGDEMELTDRRR